YPPASPAKKKQEPWHMVPVYNRLLHNTADAEKASLPLCNRSRYCTTEPVSQQTGGEAPPVVFLTDSPGKSGRSFPKNWLHICHSLLREACAFSVQTLLANASYILRYVRLWV